MLINRDFYFMAEGVVITFVMLEYKGDLSWSWEYVIFSSMLFFVAVGIMHLIETALHKGYRRFVKNGKVD